MITDDEMIEVLDELERTARGAKDTVRNGMIREMTPEERADFEKRYGEGRMLLGNFVFTRLCRSPGIPPAAIYDPNF